MVLARTAIVLGVLLVVTPAWASDAIKLPPEVTPRLRAACESDVKRLCIAESPTYDKVKSCVMRRFGELSMRCRIEIAAAGLAPRGR